LNGESLVITGPNLLCDSSKAIYTVSDIPGAIDYQWSLTNNVPIVEREGKRVIRVQFDTLSSLITVVPVGSFGACPNEGTDLLVSIEPPLSGKGQIVGLDTLCVRDTDTLSIVGMKGVSSYTWKWPNSFNLEILDTVLSSSVGLRYVVKYLEPGFQKIQAIPYSNCAQKNGDTLTKIVRVLDYATAEANSYEDVSMFGSLNAINLNGNGSSSNSASDKLNQFSYKWYSSPATPAQIANPNSLNGATITPENPETDVYLLVTNLGGRCPALDSAKIKVDYLINIPNVFSPNGDGVHDRWDILNINSFYPNAEVEVYNKWGSRVFRSAPGYPEPWDGTRNGQQLPVATYYYIIDLKNGGKPFVNSVTILR
jgi:gliding motility-associated-like protein